jgi:hypothetical protein
MGKKKPIFLNAKFWHFLVGKFNDFLGIFPCTQKNSNKMFENS